MKRIVCGVDEAGYGPNLGPLVIAATAWRADPTVGHDAFFELMECLLKDDEAVGFRGLRIGDSKIVYQSGKGLHELERSVLTLLAPLGIRPSTLEQLLGDLGVDLEAIQREEPWYFEHPVQLPVACETEELERTLDTCLTSEVWERIGLESVRLQYVTPAKFNRHLEGENKAAVLSSQSLSLVEQLLTSVGLTPSAALTVLMDRHGGRKTYADLLTEQFGEFTFLIEESPKVSRYRLGQMDVEFHVQGERYLPVAVSSMIAKYIRELSMLSFNRYWQSRLDGLKSTAGYPGDARRYYDEIAPILKKQKVRRELIWRAK